MKKVVLISVLSTIAVFVVLMLCFVRFTGATTDYSTLTDEEKARVMQAPESLDGLTADGNVYQVTAGEIRKYLKGMGKTVVYVVRPSCMGPACILPAEAERICQKGGVEICLVATSYADLFYKSGGYEHPVFVINNNAYGSSMQERYVKDFIKELTDGDEDGHFFTFDKGKYTGSHPNCQEAVENLRKS